MQFAVDWENRIDFDRLRRDRTTRLQATMRKHNLDGLINFRMENIRYMTGVRSVWWPITFITRNAAILAQEGDPILYITSGDWHMARATAKWLPEENIRPCGTMEDPGIVKTMVREHFAPTLRQMGLGGARIGLDALTFPILDELRAALPEAQFVDGDECVKEAKAVKSAEEIKCLRASVEMSDLGQGAALKAIGLGVRECQILGSLMKAMYDVGMEVAQCTLVVASGEHTAPLHRFATDRQIRRGDLVFVDCGGSLNGYFSDQTRTVVFGKPSDEQKRIYQCVYETMMSIHETCKVGNTNEQVNRAARDVIKKHGFASAGYVGVLGHSCGVSGFEAPLIGELAATGERVFELEPGMMFNCEPTVMVPGVPGGGGVRLEDNILITPTGNEVLNRTPYCMKLLGTGNCGDCDAGCGQ